MLTIDPLNVVAVREMKSHVVLVRLCNSGDGATLALLFQRLGDDVPLVRGELQISSFLIQHSAFLIRNFSFLIHNFSFLMQNASFYSRSRGCRTAR